MKVLCLHGAFGSEKNFQVQLAPFVSAVEKPGSVDFKWINGGHAVDPPPGFESYFGAPPLYRHINFDGVSAVDDVIEKIRDMPTGLSAEESMRLLMGKEELWTSGAIIDTMDRLFAIIDEDPEIDGILGYSEGATTAATLILEERRRRELDGKPRRIKYGIFFAGWPPVQVDGEHVRCLLADECEDIIDIPTCHIVGCNDPYIHGAMALYAMCDEDTAVLFDHGKGHTVPRDPRTVQELAEAIDSTLDRARVVAV